MDKNKSILTTLHKLEIPGFLIESQVLDLKATHVHFIFNGQVIKASNSDLAHCIKCNGKPIDLITQTKLDFLASHV